MNFIAICVPHLHRSFVSNQTGLFAVFLLSSSRVKRNILSRMFCFPNWRAFMNQKSEAKKPMIITSETTYISCEFSPTKLGTNLEVKHRPTKIKKSHLDMYFPTSCNFHGCFWGAMEIEQVAVAISLLVVSWVKNCQTKPERGSKTP